MQGQMFVAGKWIGGEREFSVLNPYNGSLVGKVPDAAIADVDRSVEAAQKGAEIMENTPAYRRSEILSATSRLLEERKEELAQLITLESGKAIKDARGEVTRAAQTFTFASHEACGIEGRTTPMDAVPGSEKRIAFYQSFPIGLIAAITPFNFPLNLVAHKVAPAVAAGNPVIIKPSPRTPFSAIRLVEILLEAGIPPQGIGLITASGVETVKALVTHPGVNMVSFTGSLEAGLQIKQISGIKRVCLELGANSACIIEPDSDIDLAVTRCVIGAFAYAGQVCISLQRIYVHKRVFDLFKGKFLQAVEKIAVGNPMDTKNDYGPMISEREAERCEEWIKEAEKGGARILCGGIRTKSEMAPTVLTDVQKDMKVVCREVFGPVVTLTPYDDFRQALALANDSEYGLQAGVFTKDIEKAFCAFRKLKVGGVMINDVPTFRTDNMPYGGIKNSGQGREGVKFAMSEMTEKKIVVFNL